MPITLTNPVTITEGQTTLQADTVTCVTYASIDFISNTLTILIQNGSIVDQTFVLDELLSQNNFFFIDLNTGEWNDSFDHSGTVNPTMLAAQVAQLVASRNSGEQFALATGFVLGTATAWS